MWAGACTDRAPAAQLHGGLLMEDIAARIPPQIEDRARRMEIMEVCYRHQLRYLGSTAGSSTPVWRETLEELSGRVPLFIVSNCQDGYIQCFLKVHGLEKYIRDFECQARTGQAKGREHRPGGEAQRTLPHRSM